MTRICVGVDGGGTHARAVVVDESGIELARHTGTAGLVDPRDPAAAAAVVAQLVRAALREARVETAAALCCGLAGAGRAHERETVRVALALQHIADRISVVGDAEAAMADAFPEGTGVLVVAGTGSIAWARLPDGSTVRVGGWGRILGDEGSGYDIALSGLRAITHAADGRSEPTALARALLSAIPLADPHELIAWTASATKAQIAALAPAVLDCATQGDAAATAIRDRAVDALAHMAATASLRAADPIATFALTGGLLAHGAPMRALLAEALHQIFPDPGVTDRPVDAAMGAARIAMTLTR
jgi:N-acetylglucosamine kinase-like BadF-type ATPase